MKKQTYIQPAVEVVELEVSSVLCISNETASMPDAAEEPGVECQSTGNRWGSIFDPTEE